MLRISTHIERLLLTNDCVIIPKFGGFVLHSSPAVYESEKHRFCPPYKEIVFNPALIHQDGLLPESYIQMYGFTFNKAQIELKKDIKALNNLIDKAGEIHFENIGFVKKGDDGKLLFEPDRDSSFLGLKPYGLFPFHLPPVAKDARKETPEVIQMTQSKPKSGRVIYMPVNRALLRAIGVSVAAAVLILFVSIPIKKVDNTSNTAGFIPSGMVTKNKCLPILPTDTAQVSALEVDITKETPDSKEIIRPVVAETKPAIKTEEQNQKKYYAIIGSFVTEKQANQFIQDIKMPELTTMGIVINDGRVRVYAGKFDEKKDAESYIKLLRAKEKLKDTWLFIGL